MWPPHHVIPNTPFAFSTNKIMLQPNGIHVDFRLVLVFTCYFSPNTFAATHGKACQTFEIGFAIKWEKYRLGKEMHKELGPSSKRKKKYQEKEKKNDSAATTELATLFSLQSLVCTTASYLHIAFFLFFEVFPLSICCGLCSFIHLPSCWAYSMCAQCTDARLRFALLQLLIGKFTENVY